MPPDYFEYTEEKLVSFLGQIKELLGSDFPIPATKSVLEAIQSIFTKELTRLSSVVKSSPEIKRLRVQMPIYNQEILTSFRFYLEIYKCAQFV
jgi:hypothetical protein